MLGRCLGQVVGRAVARETDNEAPVFIASPHTLDSCLWLMHETAGHGAASNGSAFRP